MGNTKWEVYQNVLAVLLYSGSRMESGKLQNYKKKHHGSIIKVVHIMCLISYIPRQQRLWWREQNLYSVIIFHSVICEELTSRFIYLKIQFWVNSLINNKDWKYTWKNWFSLVNNKNNIILCPLLKVKKNENSVINYSLSCCSKPIRPSFILGTQIKIFLMKSESFLTLHRVQYNWNVSQTHAET